MTTRTKSKAKITASPAAPKPTAFVAALRELHACSDAVEWASQHETFEQAWAKCERGDWMLWLLGRLSGEPVSDARRELVLTCCACARLSLPIFEKKYPDDHRPRNAIETAERWARREPDVTLDDVRAAAYAAAAYAAYAAYAAAAYVAAAYVAADAAAWRGARAKALAQCADIVRLRHPAPVLTTSSRKSS